MNDYQKLFSYGVALGSTAIALVLTLGLAPILTQSISVFFFVAITITTWYGGWQPGFVAIAFSTLAINIFCVPPLGQFTHLATSDLVRFIAFSLVAVVIHLLSNNLRESQRRVEQLSQKLLEESSDRLQIALDEARTSHALIKQQLEQQRLVMEMSQRIRQSLNLPEILQTTVDEVRQFLQTDRVIIFQFTTGWGGTVTVESVNDAAFALLHLHIYDPCIGEQYIEPFQQGCVTAKADIYQANISPCHVEFLAKFQVRANLVVPILKNNELWGLLVAHHCTAPRPWQDREIDLLRQIASQVSIALQQAELWEQVQIELRERQQAEVKLQEREEILQLFAQYAPAGIAMFDRDMNYLMASQQWVDEYNLDSIASLMNRSHYEIFPEISPEWRQIHQRCLAGNTEKSDEDLFVRADGTQQWISWEIRPWHTATGDIGGIIIFSIDVTHRKQAETDLRQSEARLRLAQVASNSAVWDWDVRTNTIFWSPEYYQLYGLEPTIEPNYDNWLRCIHPDDRERTSQQTLQALNARGSSELRVEFRVLRSGEIRWFAGIGQVLYDEAGDPSRLIGITLDITQAKQTEIALQELNAELEQRVKERTTELTALNNRLLMALKEQHQAKQEVEDLYNNAPCGYHSLDAEGTIIKINDTELSWLGYTRDEAIDQMNFLELVAPNSQPIFRKNFPEFKQRGWISNVELQLQCKDGSTRWVSVNATAIKDQAGNFVRSRSSLFDISDRKQAEQFLALQAVITRNMAEGICLVRVDDATIVYANPKFEQMFGYNPNELKGQPVSKVNYHSESVTAEEVNQSIRAAVLQNGEATYEVRNVKKDGTAFWCNATCSVFQHPEYGKVLVAVHQDITTRKEAELALQQQTQQERLRWSITQAIRQSLDLNAILNTAVVQVRQTLQVDRAAIYRFLPNWSGDFVVESVGRDWSKLVESDIPKVWEDTYLQETQGGRFQHHETFAVSNIYTAGLQPCHIELLEQFQAKAYAIVPIFSRATLWGLLAIYQNATPRNWQAWEVELLQQISSQLSIALQQSKLYSQLQAELQERKQTEAVLRETERRWRSLLDNVELAVIGLNLEGNVEYANPFFLKLTGYQLEEVEGANWLKQFIGFSQRNSLKRSFQEILECKLAPNYQNSIVTKAGEERMIAWSNTVLQNASGQVIGTISIGEDITERYKVERMKAEFISVVSHELRTPLTSMQAALSLLNDKLIDPLSPEGEATIQIATEGTDRLVRLVSDILDLERLESGKVRLEKHLYRIDGLVNTAIAQMQEMANQVRIRLEATPCHFQAVVDGDRLIQVLTNLLSNAIKFSPKNSVVQLSVARPDSEENPPPLLFTVGDEGRGIPVGKLESIFDRFHQIDASDSREKGGTGLGLAICRSIVQQHGGEIWAESTMGQGSRFYFTIPTAPEEIQQSEM